MPKLLGRKEKRRLDRRLSEGPSEFLRMKLKLLLLLSVDGRGVGSSLELGMTFFIETGGYLRSLFSVVGGPPSICWDLRRELLRPIIRSVMLPSVELRL